MYKPEVLTKRFEAMKKVIYCPICKKRRPLMERWKLMCPVCKLRSRIKLLH